MYVNVVHKLKIKPKRATGSIAYRLSTKILYSDIAVVHKSTQVHHLGVHLLMMLEQPSCCL